MRKPMLVLILGMVAGWSGGVIHNAEVALIARLAETTLD
jgi:hypothetical protein